MDITRGRSERREVGTIKLSARTKPSVSGSKPIKDGMVHLG